MDRSSDNLGQTISNIQRDLEELKSNQGQGGGGGGGGGEEYFAGNGINIDQSNTISVDTSVVATQTDLASKQDTLTAGSHISISDNTISATGIPTKTSDLTNDSNFSSMEVVESLPATGSDDTIYFVEASELPTGYERLSYINIPFKSPTTAYVALENIWTTTNWKMEFDFEVAQCYDYCAIFGRIDDADQDREIWINSSSIYRWRAFGYTGSTDNSFFGETVATNKRYVVSHDNLGASFVTAVNGNQTLSREKLTGTATSSMNFAFGHREGGGQLYGKIYGYKAWDGNGIVENLVPAKRTSDDALGFYDMANGTFKAMQGSGVSQLTGGDYNSYGYDTYIWDGSAYQQVGERVYLTSQLVNDSGFLTAVSWDDIQNKPTFATVATTGDYDDLIDKPTIPNPTDYYWANIKVSSSSSATTSPTFRNAYFGGSVFPHLGGNGVLTLSNQGWTSNDGTIAIDNVSIRPANGKTTMNMGTSANKWQHLYMSGNIYKGNYTLTLPNKTGTVALTSDLDTKVDIQSVVLDNQTTTILEQVKALGAAKKSYGRFACTYDGASANISDKPTGNTNGSFVCEAYASRLYSENDYNYQVICWVKEATNPYRAVVTPNTTSISWLRFPSSEGSGKLTIQENGNNVVEFYANSTINKTANIIVPTKTSDLTNDGADNTSTYVEADELATVATSGSYNDLSNKPTIPTVNDATLTITQNGTSAGTFSANASSNATIALTDTTYSDMTGATSSTAGSGGLVPAPSAGDQDKFLRGDGTWASVTPGGGEDTGWVDLRPYMVSTSVYEARPGNYYPKARRINGIVYLSGEIYCKTPVGVMTSTLLENIPEIFVPDTPEGQVNGSGVCYELSNSYYMIFIETMTNGKGRIRISQPYTKIPSTGNYQGYSLSGISPYPGK